MSIVTIEDTGVTGTKDGLEPKNQISKNGKSEILTDDLRKPYN